MTESWPNEGYAFYFYIYSLFFSPEQSPVCLNNKWYPVCLHAIVKRSVVHPKCVLSRTNLACVIFSLLSPYIACPLQSVSMVLLRCRCVYGAAGAAGWHAVQRGRKGVMANIRGKEPLTHGTGNAGLWKIHWNTHTAWHARSERWDRHTSYINTQRHTWGENTCGDEETVFLFSHAHEKTAPQTPAFWRYIKEVTFGGVGVGVGGAVI